MKTKRNKRVQQRRRTTSAAKPVHASQPFTAHLLELRRRVFWVFASIAAGAAAAYSVQQNIVAILLKPAGGQQFIYTSPGGGLNFLVQICIYSGVLVSIPVIVYNVMKFIEPVMPGSSTKYILRGSAVAGFLAIAGIVFGYVFGLPSALKFLSHQFMTDQIKALIAVQSYMSFVTMFLLASALIFQAPLILLLINRIKPLKPGRLLRLKSQRWVILVSFILGAVISPTPDIRSMMILSVPMIVSFQVGIFLIWRVNRRGKRPKSVIKLLEQDMIVQAERLRRLEESIVTPLRPEPAFAPEAVPVAEPLPEPAAELTQAPIVSKLLDGRNNYQDSIRPKRVQRRLISSI